MRFKKGDVVKYFSEKIGPYEDNVGIVIDVVKEPLGLRFKDTKVKWIAGVSAPRENWYDHRKLINIGLSTELERLLWDIE